MSTVFTSEFPVARNLGLIDYKLLSGGLGIDGLKVMKYEK